MEEKVESLKKFELTLPYLGDAQSQIDEANS